MEYEPQHIKSTPDECDSPVSQEYLKKHGVSMKQLDTWQINVVSDSQSDEMFPKLSWTEIAEVASHVAFNWNTKNGCLRIYENYYEAVSNACKVVMSKRKTETLVVKVLQGPDEKEIDEKYEDDGKDFRERQFRD